MHCMQLLNIVAYISWTLCLLKPTKLGLEVSFTQTQAAKTSSATLYRQLKNSQNKLDLGKTGLLTTKSDEILF